MSMENNIPYRDIAKGVITDIDAYNLPLGVWSWGSNVRFRNGEVTRAPVFRNVKTSLSSSSPHFLTSNSPATGLDNIYIGYLNGRVSSLNNGAETDVSIGGFSNASSEAVYTSCTLGNVLYINRGDRSPWALLPGASTFVTLTNWAPVSSPWQCGILRTVNDALIAFNVTQNGTNFPNMVITSEFALANLAPATWDYTVGTNNATRNILGDMRGAITDACALGNTMIIYGLNETWVMGLTGDVNIWGYDPLFKDQGALSANCVVEVDKTHYVFGPNDIWKHDGSSKTSICDQQTREFIYNSLKLGQASRCSVTYNVNLKELNFRYMSNDAHVFFSAQYDGCNRQATYHIPSGTWSFDDLPYVFGAVMANLDTVTTWSSDTKTWANSGGTWASLQDTAKKVMVMIGDVNSTYSLSESVYAFDLQGPGSLVPVATDLHATQGWTLIRDGLDMDQIGADLKGYKVINSVYPQGRLELNAQPISFQFGSSDYFNQPVSYGPVQTYDGNTLYKLDFNMAGRYLSMIVTHNDYHYMKLTGFDFDIDVLGEY